MTIFNGTNQGRVEKIVEILDLIEKSCVSNKAPTEEVRVLLSKVINKIESLGVLQVLDPPVAEPEEDRRNPELRKPVWVSVREMAEKAPLKDLTTALAVYINRIEDELKR